MHDEETLFPLPDDLSDALLEALRLPLAEREEAIAQLLRDHPRYERELRHQLLETLERTHADVDAAATRGEEDALPAWIGPYRVLDHLGRGGMSRVYLARQEVPIEREVAIKVLDVAFLHPEGRARFDLESRILARMEHPAIARIYDVGVTEQGRPYVVMERVLGQEILKFCDEERLGLPARIELFSQVCAAVQYAHEKGVVHRDLKPSNVFVRFVDGKAAPVILDFGLALVHDDQASQPGRATEKGRAFGTPGFMSPEQCLGELGAIDTRSDVYSLGVLLYLLLSGEPPFDAAALRQLGIQAMAQHIRESTPPPSLRIDPRSQISTVTAALRGLRSATLRSQLSGDLDWITLRAMDRDRERRYPTPLELAADLKRYLAHEPVQAGPPSRIYQLKKYVRRHRVLLAVVALVVTLLSLTSYSFANAYWAERQHAVEKQLVFDARNSRLLEQEAETLWPLDLRLEARIDGWMADCSAILARAGARRTHAALLEERARAQHVDEDERLRLEREITTLRECESRLDTWREPETGLLARLAERQRRAARVRSTLGPEHAAAWAQCRQRILENPKYDGLDLPPQLGLLPLGPDPFTELEEFAHVASGEPPARVAPRQFLGLNDDSAIILVLVPGGTYRIGAQREDPAAPHYDRLRIADESIASDEAGRTQLLDEVALDPFFIGKFEVTQGQWVRIYGENRSYYRSGKVFGNDVLSWRVTDRHPVETISWYDADRVLRRVGLCLPTEARWEAAARGGSGHPWLFELDDLSKLDRIGNLEDNTRSAVLQGSGQKASRRTLWDDGFAGTAPVGSFKPNLFGLYDVLGNVNEWCQDHYAWYHAARARAGDGLRFDPAQDKARVLRGGSYRDDHRRLRVSRRGNGDPRNASSQVGVRACRDVVRQGQDAPR